MKQNRLNDAHNKGIIQTTEFKQNNNTTLGKRKNKSELFNRIISNICKVKHEFIDYQSYLKNNEQKIIKLQAIYRTKKAKEKYKSLLKNFKYRRSIFKELVETEKNYVADLQIVIRLVINPASKFLAQEERNICFGNIQQIHELNQKFLTILQGINYPPQQSHWNEIIQIIPFFKIYFDYVKSHEQQIDKIQKLKQQKNLFADLIKKAEKDKDFRRLDLYSFIIKPVQRIPKYVLLLKEYKKYTENDHIHYSLISKTLQQFQQVADKNNLMMDQIIKNQVLFDLQQQFGNENNLQIVDPKRSFITEEPLIIISKKKRIPVIAYLLSDMILFIQRVNEKHQYQSFLKLNANSFLKRIQNQTSDFFLSVAGENQTVLIAIESLENLQRLQNFLENCIKTLKEINQKKVQQYIKGNNQVIGNLQAYCTDVQVKIMGSEIRKQSFSQYVVYIIQITINNLDQDQQDPYYQKIVQFRFSEILKIQNLVSQYFSSFHLPQIQHSKFGEANSRKLIQLRSIQIQNFLQSLLTQPEFIFGDEKNRNPILQELFLPPKFYELLFDKKLDKENLYNNSSFSQRGSGYSRSQERKLDNAYLTKQTANKYLANLNQDQDNEVTRMSRFASKGSLERLRSTSRGRKHSVQSIEDNQSNTKVRIKFILPTCEIVKEVGDNLSVAQVIHMIADAINLQERLGFKLIEKDGRILQDDQTMGQLCKTNQQGRSLKNLFGIWKEELVFEFRKVLFLFPEIECEMYHSDNVLLDILTEQAFKDLECNKYRLLPNEKNMMIAWKIVISQFDKFKQDITKESIDKKCLRDVQNMIEEIKQTLRTTFQLHDEQKRHAKRTLLFLLSKHKLYGVNFFPVSQKQTNFIMGIRHDQILVMNDKYEFLEVYYEQEIYEIQSYADLLIIQVDDIEYKYHTPYSFQIKQMWEEYCEIKLDLQEYEIENQNI